MSKGEKISIIGLLGMTTMVLCLDSPYFIPALILFGAFTLMTFAGHFLAGEGFINNDDLTKISKRKIQQNRDKVFRNWVKSGRIK